MKKIIYLCIQFMIFNILGAFILNVKSGKFHLEKLNKSKTPREKREFLLIVFQVFQNLTFNKPSSRFAFYTCTISRNKTYPIKAANEKP
jgi:hypothetical protein